MKRREITLVTDVENLAKTKETLLSIKTTNPDIIFTPPIPGSIGEMILLTIKVMDESFNQLLTIFLRRKLKLFTKEDKEKAENDLKKKIAEQEEGNYKYIDSFVNIEPPTANDLFTKNLDDYIKEGNFRAIITIYKDVKQSKHIKDKAKRILPDVLMEVIQHLYKRSIAKSMFAEEGINKLIKIGHDKVLAAEGYQKFMRYAAYYAIDLCGIYTNYIFRLIELANDNGMPRDACLKAAAKFGKVVLEDQNKFKSDISTAVRNLNYRWLDAIYDIGAKSLKDLEVTQYDKLRRHIEYARK